MRVKTPLYFLLAKYRTWRKYPRGAVIYYRRLVDAYPRNDSLRFALAQSLYRDKQYDKALEHIGLLLEKNPNTVDYQLVKIRSLVKLGQLKDARDACSDALKSNPDDYRARRLRADIELTEKNYPIAIDKYTEALAAADTSERKVYCYHSLGFIHDELGDNESSDMYNKATEFSDDKRVKQLGIGLLHYSRGWYDKALCAYEARLSEDKENALLYFELGKTYTKLLKVSKSAEAYRNFVKYDPQLKKENHILDDKLVVFDAYMGRNYACSPRAIYEYMLKDSKYKDYTFIWVFRGSSLRKHWKLHLNPRTKVVKFKSPEYFRSYARAKYWVTNSRIPYVLKSHNQQVYIQCWHGTPLKRMGHSIVGTGESSKYDKDGLVELYDHETKRFDYFLSPSRSASEYFTDAFGLKKLGKQDILLEEGYPRNDFLYNYTNRDVKRVKKQLHIPANKKVLLYAPTWRDDQHDDDRGYTYKTQADFDRLQKSLGDDWVILFRAHYFIANGFNFSKYQGFIYDVSGVDDVNDLYIVSDVLMTDYSSVFFDYANLRRPIIFFMYDLEHYMKDLRGFYIDLKELPGDIVKKESEIIEILSDLSVYNKKYSDAYQKFHDKFNYLDDGRAAERVTRRVIDE